MHGSLDRLLRDDGLAASIRDDFQDQVTTHELDEEVFAAQPLDERVLALPGFQVGKEEGALSPHDACVAIHDAEVGADVLGEGDFVDEQKIAVADGGAALAGILSPCATSMT